MHFLADHLVILVYCTKDLGPEDITLACQEMGEGYQEKTY